MDGLGHGRVRVDYFLQVLALELKLNGKGYHVDQLRGRAAHDLGAQHGLVGRVEHQLHEALGLVGGYRFADAQVERPGGLYSQPFGLGLRLIKPHGAHFGPGVDALRDDGVVEGVVPAHDILRRYLSLPAGRVGQEGKAVHVAHRVDVRSGGKHAVADANALPVPGQAQHLQAHAGQVGRAARADEYFVGLQLGAVFQYHGLNAAGDLYVRGLLAQVELNSALLERGAHGAGDLRVLPGQDVGQDLQHVHFHAQGVEEAGELKAYDAAAHYHQLFGQAGQVEHAVGIGQLVVEIPEKRGEAGAGAGGQHRRVELSLYLSLRASYGHFVRAGEGGFAADNFYLLRLEELLEGHPEFGYHLGAAGLYLVPVEHVRGEINAGTVLEQLAQPFEGVHPVARIQEGLGRDAAAVQAGAAEIPRLRDADLGAQFLQAQRRGIPAGAGPYHDNFFCHISLPLLSRGKF